MLKTIHLMDYLRELEARVAVLNLDAVNPYATPAAREEATEAWKDAYCELAVTLEDREADPAFYLLWEFADINKAAQTHLRFPQ